MGVQLEKCVQVWIMGTSRDVLWFGSTMNFNRPHYVKTISYRTDDYPLQVYL